MVVLCCRSKLLERHAEHLSIAVIFLNTVMAKVDFAPTTFISWMACPVKTMLRTAMKVAVKRTISSADTCLPQVNVKVDF